MVSVIAIVWSPAASAPSDNVAVQVAIEESGHVARERIRMHDFRKALAIPTE